MKTTIKYFFKKNNKINGFTLIEAMVVVFIISVVSITFYSVFALGTRHIANSKNRLGAVALANEKMEIVRNLDYEKIGTKKEDGNGEYVYGIPAGEILEEEIINKNTKEYKIHTFVQYVDDPYDGIEDGSPDDDISTDYKRVRIEVSWNLGGENEQKISLVSTFVPSGIEKASSGGTLSLNVINNQGIGIPQALVRIYNSDVGVDVSALTDDSGNIIFPGAPEGDNYQIEISKDGYYPVKSYPAYPESSFYPTDVHVSVVESRLNIKSIITDKYSELKLKAVDFFDNSISSLNFKLKGGKKIGNTDSDPPEAIFDFDGDFSFNSSGEKNFSLRSFGEYFFEFQNNDDFEFIKLDNDQNEVNKIDLPPEVSLEVKVIYVDKSVNSLLVRIIDEGGGSLVADAQVKLKREDISFEKDLVSDQYGQVFFPTELPELEEGSYGLTVEALGFQTINKEVEINKFTIEEVKLSEE